MNTVVSKDSDSLIAEMDKNQQEVRKMVMDSYQDMMAGKGIDYKIFFNNLEGRYKNAEV